jgi:hypothetical protein
MKGYRAGKALMLPCSVTAAAVLSPAAAHLVLELLHLRRELACCCLLAEESTLLILCVGGSVGSTASDV